MLVKRYLSSFFLMGLLAVAFVANAQRKSEISSKTKTIDGKEYYIHHVQRGETLYGLSHAYKVSVEEIENLNPKVKDGLKADAVIQIPVRVRKEVEPQMIVEDSEQQPVVEKTDFVKSPILESIAERTDTFKESDLVVEISESPEVLDSGMIVLEPDSEIIEPMENDTIVVGGYYVVEEGEDLYDIAKKFGIDLSDFKEINPGLNNNPSPETKILVPNIVNEQDYIIHKVEYNERTSSMLKRWKVKDKLFRKKNVSVGSHVFVNQIVLIPIEPVVVRPEVIELDDQVQMVVEQEQEIDEPLLVENNEKEPLFIEEIPYDMPECIALSENALKRYNVALMIPLYLYDLGSLDVSKENISKLQKARPLSFLQYYQGFMMAAEKLEKEGLKLNLTVIDVTDNVSSAHQALTQIEGMDFDMIVGPFFAKSFEVIEEYARDKGIIMVNPLSVRSSVVTGNPNVVKVKPGDTGLILTLSNLVKNYYRDSNVFLVSSEKAEDSLLMVKLQHNLELAINQEVKVSNDEFLQFARNESQRLEMGEKMMPTINVEGQEYSTNDLKNSEDDGVIIHNAVKRYKSTGEVIPHLSGVRNNLIIAYCDDNVFATQSLNGLKKVADQYPITIVGATDWAKFEKLLVESLLQMNAIYVSDFFVDYESAEVKLFIQRFRSKYAWEPQKYAYEGYDVAMYFLSALMRYGDATMECLQCYNSPMLHTRYRFFNGYQNSGDGLENYYWSVYQFDKKDIELKAIEPFKSSAK